MSIEKYNLTQNKESHGKGEPLDLKAAHEEANMLKVIASEKSGMYKDFEKPRTKEEYDKALFVLEELKEMAESEPQSEKILGELARLSVISGFGVYIFLRYLGDALVTPILEPIDAIRGKKRDARAYVKPIFTRDEILRNLDSASAKLKALKADAKEMGEVEKILESDQITLKPTDKRG